MTFLSLFAWVFTKSVTLLVNLNDFFIVVYMGFQEECDTILCLLSQVEREGLGSHFGFLFLYKWVKIMDENKEKFHSYYLETV
jgi:hypothetical protein